MLGNVECSVFVLSSECKPTLKLLCPSPVKHFFNVIWAIHQLAQDKRKVALNIATPFSLHDAYDVILNVFYVAQRFVVVLVVVKRKSNSVFIAFCYESAVQRSIK